MARRSKKDKEFIEAVTAREWAHLKSIHESDSRIVQELSEVLQVGIDEAKTYMNDWYLSYATDSGIMAGAGKMKATKAAMESLVRRAVSEMEAQLNAKHTYVPNEEIVKVMPSGSRYKKKWLSRIDLLNAHVDISLTRQAIIQVEVLGEYLTMMGEAEIIRTASILGKTILPPYEIRNMARVVTNLPFHGNRFSDRIWAQKETLRRELMKGVTRSLIGGENPKEWAKSLNGATTAAFNGNQAALERLAITESGRAQIAAQIDSYTRYGIQNYTVVCEPTACEVCMPHHGIFYKVKDAVQGVNSPIFHPRCKCSTAAHVILDENPDV